MPDAHQMAAFVRVVELGSFAKAAEELRLTPRGRFLSPRVQAFLDFMDDWLHQTHGENSPH